MQLFKTLAALPAAQGTAMALGFFDGLHIGHCEVIRAAVRWAKQNQAAPAVFTFTMEGTSFKGARLESDEKKHGRLADLGVEFCMEPPFESFKNLTAEQFVRGMQQDFKVRAVFCGPNFTFGKKAAGNVEVLRALCGQRGIAVFVIPFAQWRGAPVSSTRIRGELAAGNMEAVNAMLGRPYSIDFPVCHGKGLGHTLGVPTFNQLFPKDFQMPRNGIYITRVLLEDGWHAGATGLGSRPTVNADDTDVTCETYLPDFQGDLYGKPVVVEFMRYLAPTRRFSSLEELRQCIENAAKASQAYFAQPAFAVSPEPSDKSKFVEKTS